MLGDLIQVDYERLEALARRCGSQAEQLAALHATLTQAMHRVLDSWEGQAASKFHAEMQEKVLPTLKRMSEAIGECSASFTESAVIYRDAEQRAALLFQTGAFNDVGGSGIVDVKPLSITDRRHPLNPAARKNRMLPEGWSMTVTRNGDRFEMPRATGLSCPPAFPPSTS